MSAVAATRLLLLTVLLCPRAARAGEPAAPRTGQSCADDPGAVRGGPGRPHDDGGYDVAQDCNPERYDQDCNPETASCGNAYDACHDGMVAGCESCKSSCLGKCQSCGLACLDGGGDCQQGCLASAASCRAACIRSRGAETCFHERAGCETRVRKACAKSCPRLKRCTKACRRGPDEKAVDCQQGCGTWDCLVACDAF